MRMKRQRETEETEGERERGRTLPAQVRAYNNKHTRVRTRTEGVSTNREGDFDDGGADHRSANGEHVGAKLAGHLSRETLLPTCARTIS